MADKIVKKFMGGAMTPQEFHQKHGFPPNAKCLSCSNRPIAVGRVFMPMDELRKRDPLFDVLTDKDPAQVLQMVVQMTDGPYVCVSTAYACSTHRTELAKTLAKTPSWCIAELSLGPDPTNKVAVSMSR